MIRTGDRINLTKNLGKKSKETRTLKGKVLGVYERYFLVEADKGYRESFLKCDVTNGSITVVLANGGDISVNPKQAWSEGC